MTQAIMVFSASCCRDLAQLQAGTWRDGVCIATVLFIIFRARYSSFFFDMSQNPVEFHKYEHCLPSLGSRALLLRGGEMLAEVLKAH